MAYERINWQNEPSEATALNDVNLNKMDSAIYELDGKATTTETAITALQDGKVDKVNGKGLSQVDDVTVTQHVAYGTVVSTIKTYKQDGTEVTSQVCNGINVDSALSDSSTNPVQNKVVKGALDNKVDKESGKGLSYYDVISVARETSKGSQIGSINLIYKDGNYESNPLYNGIEVDSSMSNTSENPVQNKVVKAELDKKIDGTSEDELNVRSAMMLLTPPISNNAPYVKRIVGGGIANPYLCKLKKLIGSSVVWNQLAKAFTDGNLPSSSSDNWYATTGTATASSGICTLTPSAQYGRINQYIPYVANHKMLIKVDVKLSNSTNANLVNAGAYGLDTVAGGAANTRCSATTEWQTISFICYSTTSSVNNRLLITDARTSDWGTIQVKNYVCHDLTAMFGSTIADYVYSLETQTVGSGIAWLKSYGFFTESYYAYSSNTMQSVSVCGKKNVGKNQLDLADISGTETNAYYHNISTDYKLKANVTYTLSFDVQTSVSPFNMSVGVGTESGSYSADVAVKNNNSNGRVFITFTPTQEQLSQYEYLKIRLPRYASQTTFTYSIKDIQLELGSTVTTYEPYTKTTYPLDHTELRGLFKLDANNNLYADGDEYPSDGNGDVKYAEVDLGDLTYNYAGNNLFTAPLSTAEIPTNDLLCTNYITLPYSTTSANMTDKTIKAYGAVGNKIIYIKDSLYSDTQTFKTAMSGVKLIYPLSTPTTATLTPYTSLQNIESGGTEEFVDYGVSQGTRDVAIPCGQESEYNSGVAIPNLPTSGGKVELTYNPANGQFTWE